MVPFKEHFITLARAPGCWVVGLRFNLLLLWRSGCRPVVVGLKVPLNSVLKKYSAGSGILIQAKIKASAWKTIRKTQYSCYEKYFQVFRGFSKKSYPEKARSFTILLAKDNYKFSSAPENCGVQCWRSFSSLGHEPPRWPDSRWIPFLLSGHAKPLFHWDQAKWLYISGT